MGSKAGVTRALKERTLQRTLNLNGRHYPSHMNVKPIRVLRKKKRANRRWWVHPINSERLLSGTFYNLYNMLRADNEKFFNYFRMSQSTFDELFNKIKSKIMRQDTVMRSAIPAEEMLAVTLRYVICTK
ncbi:hypothetical protein QTP88_001540 [Uroleucon formosanum]